MHSAAALIRTRIRRRSHSPRKRQPEHLWRWEERCQSIANYDIYQSGHGPLELLKQDTRGRVRVPRERREALLAEFARSGISGAKFAPKRQAERLLTARVWRI